MCGRYNIVDNPLVHALLEDLGVDIGPLPTRYNIAPTDVAPVVYQVQGQNMLRSMRWWLVPSWSDGPSSQYAMFNARSENLQKSRAFAKPLASQRCIVPASSFIEWQKKASGKQPYLIEPVDGLFAFAGLWDYWAEGDIYSFSIITCAATASFTELHSRMPVMLEPQHYSLWLKQDTPVEALTALLYPALPGPVSLSPLDSSINNSHRKEPPLPLGEKRVIH